MKIEQIKKPKQVSYRPDLQTYQTLKSIQRDLFQTSKMKVTLSGITGTILGQYLSSTNGKLLKNIKIVSGDQA